MQPYGMSDEEMDAAGISLGEAQPGQEQRMVTDAMIEAALEVVDGVDNSACARIYLAMHAARPTADLGEDRQCSCAEIAGEDPRCILHGEGTRWRKENPDLCEVSDRLILYREALNSIANSICCGPCQEAKLVARAVLFRSGP